MSVKKGLGRSFASLIPDDLLDESFDPTANDDQTVSDLRHILIDKIVADPDQPRRIFDESGIAELAASIEIHGVLQPIVVVTKGDGYQIVAGERRYRASKLAGKTTIPALVRTLSAQHKLELSLIENIQRRDLNPMETATAYGKLRSQFNMTLEEIGMRVGGKSVSAVSNTMRLLRLPNIAKEAVAAGVLTEGQARPFVDMDETVAKELLAKVLTEGWSSRRIEQYVASQKTATAAGGEKARALREESNILSKRYSTKVLIQESRQGKGKIIIEFSSAQERERLEKQLNN